MLWKEDVWCSGKQATRKSWVEVQHETRGQPDLWHETTSQNWADVMWRHTKRKVTRIYRAIRHGFEIDSCNRLQSSDKYSSQWKVEYMGGHWFDRSRIQGQFRSRIHILRDHRTRAACLHIQGERSTIRRLPENTLSLSGEPSLLHPALEQHV